MGPNGLWSPPSLSALRARAGNTHQVAQAIAPRSRVVYVDYDPIVLAHARALLTARKATKGTALPTGASESRGGWCP